MIEVRKAAERGRSQTEWLDSRHTFSFADYFDPQHVSFGPLRVLNEDRVRPGEGFPPHGHRDMEIISYVLEGALAHRDSLGNGSVIRPGDVQRMSAGTGVRHSEFNNSRTEPVHFLQIWIVPERGGMPPSYDERRFLVDDKQGRLRLVASRDGREDSVVVHRDVDLYATVLAPGEEVVHPLAPGRKAWVQVARGAVKVNDEPLAQGDGAAVQNETAITIRSAGESEALLFDMA